MGKGIDPAIVEAENRAEAARVEVFRSQNTFAAIAETWLLDKVRKERRGKPVGRTFRATFVTAWGERAITDITPLDVVAIINAKKRKAELFRENASGTLGSEIARRAALPPPNSEKPH